MFFVVSSGRGAGRDFVFAAGGDGGREDAEERLPLRDSPPLCTLSKLFSDPLLLVLLLRRLS